MKKITVAVCNYNGSVFIGEESEDGKDLQNTLMIGTENGQVSGFKCDLCLGKEHQPGVCLLSLSWSKK